MISPTSDNPTYTPDTLPENLKGKRVVLVNHSDNLGGAAIVTFRLMQALREIGLDARMIVYSKSTEERCIRPVASRFVRGTRFALERLKLLFAVGLKYRNLFKISSGDFAVNVNKHPWVQAADIVCVNWINQGLMNVEGIRQLHRQGKKIVWTIHDMWTMTGVCHHAYECDHYFKECGNCPYLFRGGSPDDLSHRCWVQKREVFDEVPITFVTVSRWLEERARKSSLLRERNVVTLNNPFPVEKFYYDPPHDLSEYLPTHKPNVILFGAARIDDPIKGLDYAIDALNYIFDNHPDVASTTCVYFFGNLKNKQAFDRLRFSYRHLGLINDFKQLRYLYSIAKVVVSTSLYETLGGTLVEGQAGGAIPVTFGGDGRMDVVEHLKTGYIARYKDYVDIARGIIWALNADISRESLHKSVEERFAATKIASRYADIFSNSLKQYNDIKK